MASELGKGRFSAGFSTRRELPAALEEVCAQAVDSLDGAADLAVFFVSPLYGSELESLGGEIAARTGAAVSIGCTGESIVGGSREVEGKPALSLWLGRLPGTRLVPLRLEFEQTREGGSFSGWPEPLIADWPRAATILLLCDPFSFAADRLLERINEDRAGTRVVGGMASGGMGPGMNRLYLGAAAHASGAIGVLLEGSAPRTIVSQGCRPIGKPLVVTKARGNVIEQLGGRASLEVFREIYLELPTRDQRLVERGLHLGRVFTEQQPSFARGDFLIRNVIGADEQTGAIAIGDFVRVGQTVQFHVRDAESADEDLRELATHCRDAAASPPAAALLFTCNGRGTRLFTETDHDARTVRGILGEIPLAGFFAQGEIGPVGGRNFLHGFTASLLVFD